MYLLTINYKQVYQDLCQSGQFHVNALKIKTTSFAASMINYYDFSLNFFLSSLMSHPIFSTNFSPIFDVFTLQATQLFLDMKSGEQLSHINLMLCKNNYGFMKIV